MQNHGLSRRALLGGCAALIASTVACKRSNRRKIAVLYFAGLAEGKRLKANIPSFTTENDIDVTFDELPYDSIRPRQIQSFGNASADYDVVFVDDIWMYEYARKGYIRNLSELVKRDEYDFDDIIPKVAEAEGTLDGQIWLVPQRADVQVLFYNRSIFEDAAVRKTFRQRTQRDLVVPEEGVNRTV
jgi:multiple sugar transport system substrate-binding protein